MRSLIILEVEHDDVLDVQHYAEYLLVNTADDTDGLIVASNYTVKEDIPECFRLDN